MTHHPTFGTQLNWDVAGGTAYTPIGQVKDIDGPGVSTEDIEVTDHDSKLVADGFAEYMPSVPDGGEVSFVLGLDPQNAQHVGAEGTGLLGQFESNGCTLPAFQMVADICGGTATWTWRGYPKNFTPHQPVKGEYTADVTIKVSGKPSLVVA